MSRTRADLPGGDLIEPYLDSLAVTAGRLAREAAAGRCPATMVYGQGRCPLAANRDFWDQRRQQYVVGLNPDGPADDTVLLAQVMAEDGRLLATVVNYACHATTLAWQNTLISPDYPGALRETVERQTGAPCVFLQGASGDLGPREGFVGDPAVADRNGRQLAYAALSALEALPRPGMGLAYQGPVVSGATLGVWDYAAEDATTRDQQQRWSVARWPAALPYRHDAASLEETQRERDRWRQAEERARRDGDEALVRDCRARVEQMTRQVWRLESQPPGRTFPLSVTLARLGASVWLFVAGEHYQTLQTTLRGRHPAWPLLVVTHTNGWQPGYVPPACKYGYGIYQEQIATVAAGSAELLIEDIDRRLAQLVRPPAADAGIGERGASAP